MAVSKHVLVSQSHKSVLYAECPLRKTHCTYNAMYVERTVRRTTGPQNALYCLPYLCLHFLLSTVRFSSTYSALNVEGEVDCELKTMKWPENIVFLKTQNTSLKVEKEHHTLLPNLLWKGRKNMRNRLVSWLKQVVENQNLWRVRCQRFSLLAQCKSCFAFANLWLVFAVFPLFFSFSGNFFGRYDW